MLDGEILLIILTAVQASEQTLYVYQTPKVSATECSSVTLFCNFTSNGTIPGFYKWYRHSVWGPEVTNTSGELRGRVSIVRPAEFFFHKSANIHLHHLNFSDTGLYICVVTLLANSEETAHGNGTFLEVKRLVADGWKSQLAITIGCSTIAVITVLILVAVGGFLGYHNKCE
uniref:Natural cytotoxicity triggering receptor 3 n=1 Tax=Pyxicephalus adspersus TaxID=30357 RepID=A0AAV2ZKF0_PYXAD|nr:TPA: hypothetical protein GDO54_016580 [Pyxicephalus adspersus]